MTSPRSTEVVLEGLLRPDPDEPVARIPFTVPEGSARIEVAYEHDEEHIVDLGLQDPRGGPFPSREGFRGWSGGARTHAFVSTDDATPGYLPGPVQAGTWHVLLGRADVRSPGCRYRVAVTIEPVAEAPLDAPWHPGDLQTHTHHSDAQGSVDELVAAADRRGLAYLAVTDHNTVSHHAALARARGPALLTVPGMEVTSYRGHANVWGAVDWVDFRLASDEDVAWMVRRAHALGGVVSVNHPKRQPGCIGCDWSFGVPEGVDALEAWQGPWWLRNWESLARYDALLASGRRITLVGGSDRHQPAGEDLDPDDLKVGSPTTWLQASALSVPGVLAALRAGRASVSESPVGPRIEVVGADVPTGGVVPHGHSVKVRARAIGAAGEQLRWIDAHGVARERTIDSEVWDDEWSWAADGPFLRAEVVAHATAEARHDALARATRDRALPYEITLDEVRAHPWRLALSNPLYAA